MLLKQAKRECLYAQKGRDAFGEHFAVLRAFRVSRAVFPAATLQKPRVRALF